MAADVGTGTIVAFPDSGFDAEIVGVGLGGQERPSIDTTHLGSTPARTFMPGDLVNYGEIELELNFDPDKEIPIDQPAEIITITTPIPSGGIGGATIVGSAFVTGASVAIPLEDKMTATATLKWAGDITITPST